MRSPAPAGAGTAPRPAARPPGAAGTHPPPRRRPPRLPAASAPSPSMNAGPAVHERSATSAARTATRSRQPPGSEGTARIATNRSPSPNSSQETTANNAAPAAARRWQTTDQHATKEVSTGADAQASAATRPPTPPSGNSRTERSETPEYSVTGQKPGISAPGGLITGLFRRPAGTPDPGWVVDDVAGAAGRKRRARRVAVR